MAQYELDLRDYGRIVFKRKKIIIFATLMVGLLTFILTPTPKPFYKARSSVRITQSSSVEGLFLQAISYSRWNNMETQAKIIKSVPIVSMTAQRLGFIDSTLKLPQIAANPRDLKIVSDLTDKIYTAQYGKTDIIEIITTAGSREGAMEFANVLANVYIENSITEKNRRVDEVASFIEEQLKLYENKLMDSEQNLEEFKRQNIGRVPTGEEESSRLQIRLLEISRQREELEIQLEQLNRRLRSHGNTFIDWVSNIFGDMALNDLNRRLIDLQVEKETLLIYHTDKSPEVVDLETQILKMIADIAKELEDKMVELEAEEAKLNSILDAYPRNLMLFRRLQREVTVNEEVYSMLRQTHQQAQIKKSERIREINLVEFATYAQKFTAGGRLNKTFLGVIVGLILGLVIAFVAETLDTSIGAIEDVEDYLKVPVLGVIPHFDQEEIKNRILKKYPRAEEDPYLDMYTRLVTQFRPKSPMSEAYRTLRTNIEFARMKRDGGNMFVITSASMLEGKSTTIANLGITLAQMGHRTLLVGCNLRRPTIYKIFGLDPGPGVKDIMLGQITWRECIRSINDIVLGKMSIGEDLLRTSGWDRLYILTSGGVYPNPSEILSSPKMAEFLREVRDEFDMILIDCPPILPVTDAAILGSRVDGCILVYQVGKVARGALRRAKQHLEAVNAQVWGVVLNDFKAEISGFQEGVYYGKYYGEDSEKKRWIKIEKITNIKEFFGAVTERVTGIFKSKWKIEAEKSDELTQAELDKEIDTDKEAAALVNNSIGVDTGQKQDSKTV